MAVSRIPASSISIVLCFAIAASLAGVAQSLSCGGSSENLCPTFAFCDEQASPSAVCVCEPGAMGDGDSCTKKGWTVRYNIQLVGTEQISAPLDTLLYNAEARLVDWDNYAAGYAALMFENVTDMPAGFVTSMYHELDKIDIDGEEKLFLVVNAVFEDPDEASTARNVLTDNIDSGGKSAFGVQLSNAYVEPRVYSWELQTTSGPIQIKPFGLNVLGVSFSPTCANAQNNYSETGCWEVSIEYTTGVDSFNTLFIPRAVLPVNFTFGEDYDYASMANPTCNPEACLLNGKPDPDCTTAEQDTMCTPAELNYLNWEKTALDTFTASSFPCGSADYDPSDVHIKQEYLKKPRLPSPPDAVTSCCLPEFFDMYRPIAEFEAFFSFDGTEGSKSEQSVGELSRIRVRKDTCDGGHVEMWHRPSWPVVYLEVPIPLKFSNSDGDWTEINCVQGLNALWHSKLNSQDTKDYGFYFQEYGNPDSVTGALGFFDNFANCTDGQACNCLAPCEVGCREGTSFCYDTDTLPYENGEFKWMNDDTCWKLSDDILSTENILSDDQTLPGTTLRKIQGKLDMGCYDDGEVMSWVIQPQAEWTIDYGAGLQTPEVTVSSIFGPDETPVVIIDVLSLSLEDENDPTEKIGDRWDVLQVGICKHGGYVNDQNYDKRKYYIQECMDEFGSYYTPPNISDWPVSVIQPPCQDEKCYFQNVNGDGDASNSSNFLQEQPGPKGFFTWAAALNGAAGDGSELWYQVKTLNSDLSTFTESAMPPATASANLQAEQPWTVATGSDLTNSFLAGKTAEQLLTAVGDAGSSYPNMEIPDGLTCKTTGPPQSQGYGPVPSTWLDSVLEEPEDFGPIPEGDCDWNRKFCTAYVDFTSVDGWGTKGRPPVKQCDEVLWETGQLEKYSVGVTMPVQSGVRKGFRVVACTGSAIVKFISDAHSAHSTGFSIDYIVVPASELQYWTGESLGFNQGGWTCPIEPFIDCTNSECNVDPTDQSYITPTMEYGQTLSPDGTSTGNPFVQGYYGMVFAPPVQESVGEWYDNANAFCDADVIEERFGVTMQVPSMNEIPPNIMTGNFSGMDSAWVEFAAVVDPFFRSYQATVYLDDKELREKAGQLKGTVGVEYSIDTFIGMANFNPTNSKFLDPAGVQTALHLERTSFFTVSTHGTNEYTFLEYVNLRLVTILEADLSLLTEGSDQFSDRTGEIARGNEAQYLQVTFTVGSQYKPHTSGLIPYDSVVVSKGDFLTSTATRATRKETCDQWVNGADGGFPDKAFFQTSLARDCAPKAQMCVSPAAIPDNFVSFNIPLGKDYLPAGSGALDKSVFVEMVVSADDTTPEANPKQMKTTLTGSIPVVDGGENIFCDGIFAKTDLKDVVNMDIIFGTANSNAEISRLTILTDVASTDLQSSTTQTFTTDSIEAGLMTLVAKGDSTYFTLGGTQAYGVELEDVITIHIMEADGVNTVYDSVNNLIATSGDDNRDTNGAVDTDGYNLNDAFNFVIDRNTNRAHLNPTQDLLELCPYRPQRPVTDAGSFPPTCVTRRDIQGRDPQTPTGGTALAIEVDYDGANGNPEWMQTVLGGSTFSSNLGAAYAKAIAANYSIDSSNNRYKRAWWINPGYEWTPTQTYGKSIFSISQKIILFALLNLNEGFNNVRRSGSRRAILQSGTENTGAGVGSTSVTFKTSPQALLAQVYKDEYPEAFVAVYEVTTKLTAAEACLDTESLRSALNENFNDWIKGTAKNLVEDTVQVSRVTVNRGSVSCSRRRGISRRLLEATGSDATATAEMLLVFKSEENSKFDQQKFVSKNGDILEITGFSGGPVVTDGPVTDMPDGEEDEGGNNLALIIGCVVGGVVLVLVAAFFIYRAVRGGEEEDFTEVAGVTVRDLKAQLTVTPGQVPAQSGGSQPGSQTSQQMAEYLQGSMGSRNTSTGYAH